MAAEQSPEAKELSLVGKVEMRIALADGDQKLQATLNTYLAPLLLKLASEHMSVRNKVCTYRQMIFVSCHSSTNRKLDMI
jgi:proteasome component ECM29